MVSELGQSTARNLQDDDISFTSTPRSRIPRGVDAILTQQYDQFPMARQVHLGRVRYYRRSGPPVYDDGDIVFGRVLTNESIKHEDKFVADKAKGKVTVKLEQHSGPNQGIIGVKPVAGDKKVSMSFFNGVDSTKMATITLYRWTDTDKGPQRQTLRRHTFPLPQSVLGPRGEIDQIYLEGSPLPDELTKVIYDFRMGRGEFAQPPKKK